MTVRATCPAAELFTDAVGQPMARCRIAHESIDAHENLASLVGFCCGNYEACPTWREARDRDRELRRELEREHAEDADRHHRRPRISAGR